MNSNCNEINLVLQENPLPARLELYRRNKIFTDVKIRIGNMEMEAHKIVLEGVSPVIRAMFSHNWVNENVLEFQKDYVDPEILDDLLKFFYTARIKITSENAFSLCLASHFLHIPDLLRESERFLSLNVSNENVVNLHILSNKLELENLKQSCAKFFAKEFKTVLNDDKLMSLNYEKITKISEEMKIGNEFNKILKEKMFAFFISWVENDSQSREAFLPNLLKFLPLSELSLAFLMEHVSIHPLVNNSLACSRILNEALNKTYSASRSKQNSGSYQSGKSQLYCLGGINENNEKLSSVLQLNAINKKWRSLPQMKTTKECFGATVIRKQIYVCGGWVRNEKSNKLEMFDCEKNNWTELAPMQNTRSLMGMTTLNEEIYVAGGYDASGNLLSTVSKYSPPTNTWTQVKAMNETRYCHELVTLNGAIYAIGGYDKNTVERYDLLTDTWSFVAPTQHKHFYFGATSHQNRIYVLSEKGFEVYEPHFNNWQDLPSFNIGEGTQLVSMNDKLWAIGGGERKNYRKASKQIFEFNTTNNSWNQLLGMNVARMYHRAVVVNV